MEIKFLQGFVLVLVFVGMILGVGVLVLDKFQRATRTTTTVVDTANNLSTGSSVDFTDTYCLTLTQVDNGNTVYYPNASYADSFNLTWTDLDGCVLGYSAIAGCTLPLCNVTYTYGAAEASSTALINANNAITPIASTWLSLIVTVAVLAIILTLVITSFAGKRE
jgi:hypothetical protein